MSEGSSPANETELLAWSVLRAADRTQARGTTVRLVVPRAPDVAHDLDIEVAEERLLTAEEWLVERGYLATANVGLTRGAYTITPAGLVWLRGWGQMEGEMKLWTNRVTRRQALKAAALAMGSAGGRLPDHALYVPGAR